MRKLIKTPIAVALSTLLFLPVMPAPPAHAAGTMAAALVGGGSVWPGLTAMPNTHQWNATLIGPAAGVVGPYVPDNLTCLIGWTSVKSEQLGAGAGLGAYDCWANTPGSWRGMVAVVRTGTVVSVTFSPDTVWTVANSMVGTATCLMLPVQIPPAAVSNYSLTCAGAAVVITP